jgi:serine/threonine protein kinase
MSEETLFHEALARPLVERAAFLDQVCAGQPQLRAAIEALVAAHEALGSLQNRPLTSGQPTPESDNPMSTTDHHPKMEPGGVIAGRYTLQERIGEGGMGEVWVAKQTEPVKRKVALKLIKAGKDSKAVLARFDQERQALALMDHPNIAKILDGGLTYDRRPFFVMELVNGLPLNRFCDQAKLTPRERLELFVPICQAVQHAHQKGIVHRDLKPANILVTLYDGEPIPKVIDFGLAKAIGNKLTEESLSTQFGSVVGTLEYMAPEQAGYSGIDIDTRADIYSLGVILYELLTGLRPIDAERANKAALAEMIRIIQEEEPSKPSTRLSTDESLPSLAALRGTEPKQLMALLRGELDWVVMKCLEKQRERRYETASGLARDLQRFLADEPVEARPPSAGYRFRKLFKRNKGIVLAASLVLAALIAGMAGTTFGFIRASVRAEGERLAKLDAEIKKAEAETQKARAEAEKQKAEEEKRIAQAVRDFLQYRLLGQADLRLQANALLRAGSSAANAERNPTIRELLVRAAKELAADKIEANFPNQPLLQAEILKTVGDTFRGIGDHERAVGFLQRSATLGKEHLGADHPDTLGTLNTLAWACLEAGHLKDAIALFEQVSEVRKRKLGADHRDTLGTLHNLACAYHAAGERKEAIALFEQVRVAQVRNLGADHPDTLTTMINLASAYHNAGEWKEAIKLFEQVRDAHMKKLGVDHPDTGVTLNNLALAYLAVGRLNEAIALFEQVRDFEVKKLGADHPYTFTTLNNLALAYRSAGKLEEALELLQQVYAASVKKLGTDHPSTLTALNNLAAAHLALGRLNEATKLFEQVRDARMKKLGADHPDTIITLNNLASAYRNAGKLKEALELLEQVREVELKAFGADHPETLNALNNLASAYWSAKHLDKSVPLFEDVLKRREAKLGRQHLDTQTTVANLGVNYKDAGRLSEATPLLEEAYRASHQFPTLRWVGQQLLDAYMKTSRPSQAAKLIHEQLADARTALPKESPQLAAELAQFGRILVQLEAYADAELLLRECLAIREKTQSDLWTTFNTQSMLGGALLGQKKYAEAEPLLLKGYGGMKQHEKTIPPQGEIRLPEAVERLAQLYEAIGKKDTAAKWHSELEKLKPPVKPERKP